MSKRLIALAALFAFVATGCTMMESMGLWSPTTDESTGGPTGLLNSIVTGAQGVLDFTMPQLAGVWAALAATVGVSRKANRDNLGRIFSKGTDASETVGAVTRLITFQGADDDQQKQLVAIKAKNFASKAAG